MRLFERFSPALEAALQESVGSPIHPLQDMLSFQLAWDTPLRPLLPRLRATLCLLTCEALSGQYRSALPVAVGVELIHHQGMVHQDIHAAGPAEVNTTVGGRWGPGQAINAGDGLHAMARLALTRLQDHVHSADTVLRALHILDQACVQMCEGQHMELVFYRQEDLGIENYLNMVSFRTGVLMGCAAQLGALVAGSDQGVQQLCHQAGSQLGTAHHIQQDVVRLWGSGGQGSNGSAAVTTGGFPVVYALQQTTGGKRAQLAALCRTVPAATVEHDRLLSLLDEVQARQHSQHVAEYHVAQALQSLARLDVSSYARSSFDELGHYILAEEI